MGVSNEIFDGDDVFGDLHLSFQIIHPFLFRFWLLRLFLTHVCAEIRLECSKEKYRN